MKEEKRKGEICFIKKESLKYQSCAFPLKMEELDPSLLQEIFKNPQAVQYGDFTLQDEIERLEIRNASFPSYTQFTCPCEKTTLVLLNCQIGEDKDFAFPRLQFVGGRILLDSLETKDEKTYSVLARDVQDFHLNCCPTLGRLVYHLDGASLKDSHLLIEGDATTSLMEHLAFSKIEMKRVQNLLLEDGIGTFLLEDSHVKMSPHYLGSDIQKIQLRGSQLDLQSETRLDKIPLWIENSTLHVLEKTHLPDGSIVLQNKVLEETDFARIQLLSQLKGMKEHLEKREKFPIETVVESFKRQTEESLMMDQEILYHARQMLKKAQLAYQEAQKNYASLEDKILGKKALEEKRIQKVEKDIEEFIGKQKVKTLGQGKPSK